MKEIHRFLNENWTLLAVVVTIPALYFFIQTFRYHLNGVTTPTTKVMGF